MTKADPPQCCECSHFQQELTLLRNEQASLRATVASLLNQLSMALQANAELRIENQTLRDEIARLKGTPPRPKIPPGGLENSGKGPKGGSGNKGNPGRGKHPRKKKTGLSFHNISRLKPDNIPEGAVFKGTRKYDVQDLVCQAYNTRYEIERWQLPDGTYIEGQIPLHVQGHYGAALRAYAITLAHSCRFNQDAYDYLAAYKDTEWLIAAFKIRNDPAFHTQDPGKTFLEELGHLNSNTIRLLTEAGLFASLIEHGVPKNLNVHSDDAPQFEIFKQSLCWIHEERHYRKLIPSHPELAAEIEKVRASIWQLYQDLKAYKQSLTCRRLGICFYEYLVDRFLILNKISNLGTVIRERVKAAKTTSPPIFAEALGVILSAA